MVASTSRQTILDRLRVRSLEPVAHPTIDRTKTVIYDDPVAKFTEILTWVGGRVHLINELSEVQGALQQLPEFNTATWIASTVPNAVQGNFHLPQVDDPHALAAVDWSILKGEFCVAENGAIWVASANLTERALVFIAQHLVLIVSRSEMVMHMHDAYRRVQEASEYQVGRPTFGVFVSGPSKTADIEQSLVLGAHGCRTLEVFLTP
jgi:L-lactate dehydrogenase complex protein LldG